MVKIRELEYPVLVVGAKNSKWILFHIVEGPSRYFNLFRLPLVNEYDQGTIFDSSGRVCEYNGMLAWPALGLKSWSKAILEFLAVPAILFRLYSLFFSVGPKVVHVRQPEPEEFKDAILDALRIHNKQEHIDTLSTLFENGYGEMPPASDPKSTIRWVDGWITRRSLKMADPDDVDDDHPAMQDGD